MATSTKYDLTKPPHLGFKQLFDKVDKDGSGAIDHEEFTVLLNMLGMSASKQDVESLIKAADTDGNQAIDIDEFIDAILKAAAEGVMNNDGKSFASVIRIMEQNCPLEWEMERVGKNITFDKDAASAKKSGPGFSVARMNPWLSKHTGNLLLGVENIQGDVWIGVMARNFNPEGEWWDMPFFPEGDSKEELAKYPKKDLVTAVCASTGVVHVKGVPDKNAKLLPFGKKGQPTQLQIEIDVLKTTLTMSLLKKDADGNDSVASSIDLSNKMSELAVAVCFGPTTGEAATSVRILGSSCIKVDKLKASSEDGQQLNSIQAQGVGEAELFGP